MTPDEENTRHVCTLGTVIALFGVLCVFVILAAGYWL